MKPTNFLTALLNTLTQPSYYLYILNQKISFSLKFLLTSYLIIGLFVSSIVIIHDIPSYLKMFSASMTELKQNYPQNLSFEYQDGKLKSSQNPTVVSYPTVIDKKYRLYQNLALIDTNLASPVESDALIIVGQDQLWIKDTPTTQINFKLQQLPYLDQNFVIDETSLDSWTQKWYTKIDQILNNVKFLIPIVLPIMLLLARLWPNIIDVILIFLLLKIGGTVLKFSKILQLSFHIMVVAEIVAQITGYIYPGSTIDMYTITYWIWFTMIFFSLRKVQAVKIAK